MKTRTESTVRLMAVASASSGLGDALYARVRRHEGTRCPPGGWAVVTDEGEIHVHPTRRGSRRAVDVIALNSADNVAVALSTLDVGIDTPQQVKTLKTPPVWMKQTRRPSSGCPSPRS